MEQSKRTFGVWLMEGWLHLHGMLPLGYHRWWGRVIGKALYGVFHYRSDVVMTNLARSFPEKKYKELTQISKQFYIHLATVYTTLIWYGSCKGDKGRKRLLESRLLEITNPEEAARLLSNKNQLMVIYPHTGNWESMASLALFGPEEKMGFLTVQAAVVYKAVSNKFWDRIMEDLRLAPIIDFPGMEGYLESKKVHRTALSNRGKKYVYFFNTDQYPYEGASTIPVTFMHQPTLTMKGGPQLARKLDMNVAYMRSRCREDGGYSYTFIPLAEPASAATPEEMMQKYYELLEEDLREQPWNYLWSHKRWK